MAKQEKIREGVESRVANLLVLCGVSRQQSIGDARELVGAWFKWMGEEGAVIKVGDDIKIEMTDGTKIPGFARYEPLIKEASNGGQTD